MRNQRGVTLIALVITIIVLLILAGVSIAMLTGDNGILTNASKAQAETDQKNAIEKIDLALQAIKTEALVQKNSDTTFDPVNVTEDANILIKSSVTGLAESETGAGNAQYNISASAGTITITYANSATGTNVSGKIVFDDQAKGTITSAQQQS